jgi:Trk K+ transport system NAD-binding subunit
MRQEPLPHGRQWAEAVGASGGRVAHVEHYAGGPAGRRGAGANPPPAHPAAVPVTDSVIDTAPMQPAADGHVVVCGVRGVGLRVVEQLRAVGAEVVLVEDDGPPDPGATRLLDGWGVPRVAGRSREALVAAGVERASAVVCVQDDDLRAMESALAARRLRPDVRIVLQMANEAVGRALAGAIGAGRVLDVAALSAPSVVEACLGLRAHEVDVAGHRFVAAEVVAGRAGTLRELYGDLAPLAVTGSAPAVCPGRDHPVAAGDQVTLAGPADRFPAGIGDPPERARHAAGARSAGAARAVLRAELGGNPSITRLLRALVAEADRRLRITLLALVGVFAVSVVVLRLGYRDPSGQGMSTLDAVYFTVETIATVGYGDFNFRDQPDWLRAYAVALMGMGAVLAAILFAMLTQLLVSSRLERSFGQSRVGATRNHVIVVGLGSVGLRVVEGLRAAGSRVVVVERDEDNRHLGRARALGVPVLHGDATDPDVLSRANLGAAAAVALLTSDDLVNIETGLAVRDQLGEQRADTPVVVRVFDRALGDTLQETLGFPHVRSTAALAAPWFVGAALGLDVVATFSLGTLPFVLGRIRVEPGGILDGLAMGELAARTRVVAIHRAAVDGVRALEYPPRRGTRFAAGDDAYLMGPHEEMLEVLREDTDVPPLAPRQ